jgi:hypothetical protein
METKIVNRTIHPDTHKSENSYRVKIGKINFYDQLIVNIHHEKIGFIGTYIFEGKEIASYESIHFKAEETTGIVNIQWIQKLKFQKSTNE